jgi:ubiquinone/menaquinone biosynthesis C-methylase UbiE
MSWFTWFRRKRNASQPTNANDGAQDKTTGLIAGRIRTRGLPYLMPYDVEELNRLDFQHYMLRAVLHGNYAAPIVNPKNVLDVGTGTGRWAREVAAAFPDANVIGIDINLPPVDDAALGKIDTLRPPNYTFAPGNILEGLNFPDGSFDFVHQRALFAAIPHDRWPQVAGELVRLTRPGGWVESLEVTEFVDAWPASTQLNDWMNTVMARRGVDVADGGRVAEYLRGAGLTKVNQRTLSMPCGDAGGHNGKMLATNWFSLLDGVGGLVIALGLTTKERFADAVAASRVELASPQGTASLPVYIAYGQRDA